MTVFFRIECSKASCSACLMDCLVSSSAKSVEDIVDSSVGLICEAAIRLCRTTRSGLLKLNIIIRKRSLWPHVNEIGVYKEESTHLYLAATLRLPVFASGSAYSSNIHSSKSVAKRFDLSSSTSFSSGVSSSGFFSIEMSSASEVSCRTGYRKNISRNNSCNLVKQYFLAASAPAFEASDSERFLFDSGCDAADCLRFKGPLGPGDAEMVRARVLDEVTLA